MSSASAEQTARSTLQQTTASVPLCSVPALHKACGALAGLWLLTCSINAAIITENFATNPLSRGWRSFGETNLFSWAAGAQVLNVTWDSARSNSFYYFPLATIVNRDDDLSMAFDLQLADVAGGVNSNKPSTFQLAVGFLNLADATRPTFLRGNGALSPNLVEFDFFPDTGFGPTIWPSMVSTNSVLNYNGAGDYTILDLPIGPWLRITMSYTATNKTLATSILTNDISVAAVHPVSLNASFTDFRVGAFAIASYSDVGQDPQYGGSLLAHGQIDNIQLTFPPPPVQNLVGTFTSNQWQVTFTSRTHWLYTLERSTNLISWTVVSSPAAGNGLSLTLVDTNTVLARNFYRVNATRP
jgi:hypothetical protein